MNENKLYYWLSLSGMSDRRLNALLSVYSPLEVWDELPHSEKLKELIGEKYCTALLNNRYENLINEKLNELNEKGIRMVTRASEKFPSRLLQQEVCPPVLLYYKGDISLAETNCVAIVGTRACSVYGKEVAERLASDFALAGITVVSGLATGIDGYAHAQALAAGGKTIAVLGGGLEHVTPVSNQRLCDEIEYSGLILTQYAPSVTPTKYTFPERNRIIAGLSIATVVVEAGEKSGALITAEFALEQNREVFAVPGNITSTKSKGCNNLIYEGARPALSAESILTDLRLNIPKKEKTDVCTLDFLEEKIYTLLREGDKSLDELVELTEMRPSEVTSSIIGMEIKGLIIRRANLFGVK